MVGIVGDRHKVLKDFAYTLVKKGAIARFLYFYKVGNIDDFVDFAEFPSFGFAILVNR